MLYITLLERVVERCNDPKSKDYGRVIKMTKRPVDGYGTYTSTIVPRAGEVILISDGRAFDVVQVIHGKRSCAGYWHDDINVEVVPHVCEHSFNAGGYSFNEEWPLITDLELDSKE